MNRPGNEVRLIGHRGASAWLPENTLESFEVAIEEQAAPSTNATDVIQASRRLAVKANMSTKKSPATAEAMIQIHLYCVRRKASASC